MQAQQTKEELIKQVPERWRGTTFENVTDVDIEEMVEEISSKGNNISLGAPYLLETVRSFLQAFRCRRCGVCCEGKDAVGGIALLREEVEVLAELAGVSKRKFKDTHTYIRDGERKMRYPCSFYSVETHSCSIYQRRPSVCRLYPLAPPYWDQVSKIKTMQIDPSCPEAKAIAIQLGKLQCHIYQQGVKRR